MSDTVFEDSFSEEVWLTTYKDHQDTCIDDTFKRVANAIASVEKNDILRKEWSDKFYDMLSDFKVTVGGRIYANAGAEFKGTTLMNCFVGPKPLQDQDSLEGIFEVLVKQAKTLKSEGGWGMNFSFIRPRGAFIHGIGVESPGSVKYMELFDKSSDIITAGSGKKSTNSKAKGKIRKGAQMSVLDIWHPDIEEFITAKLTPGRLSKFNLSVNCSNEFMDKLVRIQELESQHKDYKEEDKWDLIFPDTTFNKYKKEWDGNIQLWKSKNYPIIIYKTVSILELWDLVMQSTYSRNDPGVLFLDIANKTHAFNYNPSVNISATNPCAEQCLPFGGVCNLGSINLTQFIKEKGFDFSKLKTYTQYLVRFLDNVNEYTSAPLPEYLNSIRNRRRIGIGILGWASALYLIKTRFGSDEAYKIQQELMEFITHTSTSYSIDLAIEKDMFSECEPEKHAESYFWKQIDLPKNEVDRIRKHGIRNSALFSIQPTGNTSVLANIVSGGLEPVFLPEYIRTVIVNSLPDHLKEVCPKYWEGEFKETSMFKLVKEGEDEILKGKDEFGTVYKIDKNRGLTKEVLCEDYAVRHLKKKNQWDDKADWFVTTTNLTVDEHVKDLQGFGKWIDSSMSKTVNIPNNYSYDKFQDLYVNAYKTGYLKGITTYRAGTMMTVLSANKSISIPKTTAPKRPKELSADIFHPTIKGQRFYVVVGLLGDEPYEIFVGVNHDHEGEIIISKSIVEGSVNKESKGQYILVSNGHKFVLNNNNLDPSADALSRLVSASLRHGTPIDFIVDQLEKAHGDLYAFSRVLARALKKYIPDGELKTSQKCPMCEKESLVRREGCKLCSSCGWTAC